MEQLYKIVSDPWTITNQDPNSHVATVAILLVQTQQ